MTPGPLHSAALLLHGLSPADRAWMLAALPQAERDAVQPLLDELQALGIPADPALVEDCTGEDTWLRRLDAQGLAVLARALAGEPPGLTRALLRAGADSRVPRLLAGLDRDRRRQVQELMPADEPPPRLRAALLQALEVRCAGSNAQPEPARRRGWLRLREHWRARP